MHGVIKISLTGLAFAGFLAQAALPAAAGEVQHRINEQQMRIHQGRVSGELTRGERMRDQRRLNAIRRERNRDLRRNGGHLTPREYAHINRQLNHNSARIYRTKHNGTFR